MFPAVPEGMGDQWEIRRIFTSDMAHEDNDTHDVYIRHVRH